MTKTHSTKVHWASFLKTTKFVSLLQYGIWYSVANYIHVYIHALHEINVFLYIHTNVYACIYR